MWNISPDKTDSSVLPVIHSTFDPVALVPALEARYDLGEITDCVLYRRYANDVFRITTADRGAYYLKVHRKDWRSTSDVAWGLKIQGHLLTHGVPVARPVKRRDGSALTVLNAPEGERAAVLYAQAPGLKPQRPFSAELYTTFGRSAARLHTALDTLPDTSGRPPDGIETLVLCPGRVLRTLLDAVPDDRHAIDAIVIRLAREIDQRVSVLDWGICHGDLTLDNFTITEDGAITFYDFDLATLSWRARDPCGVYAASRLLPHAQDFWAAFLAGYRAVRRFSAEDERAVPLMYAAHQFWDLGHEVSRWSRWSGQWRVSQETITARLNEIQHWIDTELD
jgi:Ser/Thr protein kinase RdoA (MazF antagonist)